MPQMSPMNWIILFIFFNFVFYLSLVKLFFISKLFKNKNIDNLFLFKVFNQSI